MAGIQSEGRVTPIQSFFCQRNVFITGVTGFMGKVLLEKLLRSCPEIGLCYVLVRPKNGVNPHQRIKQLLECKLFENVRSTQPSVAMKVVPVCGDILEPFFGLSSEDQERVCHHTSVVFHSAATVKFDEELKISVMMNVVGVKYLVALCQKMPLLESLVHVSTAYANCDRESIGERVYRVKLHPHKLIDAVQWMDTETMGAITSKLIGSRPNTYTYTKAMAESLIAEEGKDLPIAIVRPSIVGASWAEPFPGWVDNLNGPTGLLLAIGKGLLRTMQGNLHATADLIPVDMATNALIAVAWYTALEKPANMMVYNCTTGQMNQFTWGQLERLSYECFMKNPCNDMARIPNPRFTPSKLTKSIFVALDHILPAYVMDGCLRLIGRRPMYQFVRIQERLLKVVGTFEFFTSRHWNFSNDNICMLLNRLSLGDKELFPFDPRSIDWPRYMENYCLGAKQFILKENISELPKARLALQRLPSALLSTNLCRRKRIDTMVKLGVSIIMWRVLVKRLPVLNSLWNLFLHWVLYICKRIPMMARSS